MTESFSKDHMEIYLIIMEIVCFSVCNQNYITTQVTIPLVIYVTFSLILFLFKPQLLIKLFYIINTVGLILLVWVGHKVSFLCGTTHKPRLMGGRWKKLRRSHRHSPSRGAPQAMCNKPIPTSLNQSGRCCLGNGPLGSTMLA